LAKDRTNKYDSTNLSIQAFTTNLHTQKLPTLQRQHEEKWSFFKIGSDRCLSCNQVETQTHIWECQHTQNCFNTIKNKVQQHLEDNWEGSISTPKNQTEYMKEYIDVLAINKKSLSEPISKGLVTDTYITEIKERMKYFNQSRPYHRQFKYSMTLVATLAACYVRAMYETIWKPRTDRIYKINKQLQDTITTSNLSEDEPPTHDDISFANNHYDRPPNDHCQGLLI